MLSCEYSIGSFWHVWKAKEAHITFYNSKIEMLELHF